ncbi:MAG: transporter substrate-binding domain-containing protein [Pseudomonadota bacterium]
MRTYPIVFAGLLCMGWSSAVLAQQKTFTIGVEDLEYYPQKSHKGDEFIGFGRELLDAFAKSRGYTFKYKILPLNRLFLENLKTKSLDFQYPDNSYWEAHLRKGVTVHYSKPVMPYIDGVMVLPENKGRGINNFKMLGTMTGFTPWNYLDLIKQKRVTVFENDSFIALLKQVSLKRVDGAYINVEVAKYQLREMLHQPDMLVFDPDLPHTKDFYYFSSVKHPKVIEEFNKFLATEVGTYEQIRKKLGIESSIHSQH